MRQASRRSWRIGQRRPVRVVYLAYRASLQAQALTLVAKKLKASLAVEGELGDDGLSTFGDDGEDLLMALARSLTERVEASDDSLEGLFAETRESERRLEVVLDTIDTESRSLSSAEANTIPTEPVSPHRTSGPAWLIEGGDARPGSSTADAQQLRLF